MAMELKDYQISSLNTVLPRALDYHFMNFQRLEVLAHPSFLRKGMKLEDARPHFDAANHIKFEVQAYVCQLRRLRFFLVSVGLERPTIDPVLTEIWDTVMDRDGMISMLANKWASHRSYDYPLGEDDDRLHAEVLLNLDGSVTMWSGDHMVLNIESHELDLCSFHPKVLSFITWMFAELSSRG